MKWYQKLHWKIIIGMVLGLGWGILASVMGWQQFTIDWISPWGKIFINMLKLIAVPLVLTSLIVGVASLSDIKKLSRMGGKTILIYLCTTAIAVTIGLLAVNILQPGKSIPKELTDKLQKSYQAKVADKESNAKKAKERGPLQPIVEMVPENIVESAGNNRNMLQVVIVAILFGIALNISASIGSVIFAFFDDKYGPRIIIKFCLLSLICICSLILITDSKIFFWIFVIW